MNRQDKRKFAKTINTPQKLEEFAARLEHNIKIEYEQKYEKKLIGQIDLFILTIVYTLHFNQKTKFGNARIQDFLEDLFATVNMFKTGEYNPNDYLKQLQDDGIIWAINQNKGG